MIKTLILCLFIFSIPGRTAAQLTRSDTVSAQMMLLKSCRPDTGRIKLLLALSGYYIDKPNENKKDLDSAYTFLNQALKLSEDLHRIEWRNKTLALTASCDAQAGRLSHAKACFIQIIDYYHKINHQQQEAESWNALGKLIPADNKNDIPYKIQCYERARWRF